MNSFEHLIRNLRGNRERIVFTEELYNEQEPYDANTIVAYL